MRSKLALAASLILILPALIGARGQLTTRLRVSELDHSPLIVGTLRITLAKLKGASVEAQVENLSSDFATYSPGLLLVVGSDNQQADILGVQSGSSQYTASERKIAPYARIRHAYVLSDSVRLPARLYYGDKLLAIIAE